MPTLKNALMTQDLKCIAGSGMFTGGRVLTYLKQLIDVFFNIGLVGWFFRQKEPRGRQPNWKGAHKLSFSANNYPSKQNHHLESHRPRRSRMRINAFG